MSGFFVSKEHGWFNVWVLIIVTAIAAVFATTTFLVADFCYVMLLAILGKVKISQIYRYMSKTGWGTGELQAYMKVKGKEEFRKLIVCE